jgi:SAM-dependent methyltransferase
MPNFAKTLIKRILRSSGYAIVRSHEARPFIPGSPRILGSYPPAAQILTPQLGTRDNWFIRDGYQHRTAVSYFDDSARADEWQLEVYQFAREICDREGFTTVCDVGCGSGFKLLKFFSDLTTVGVDLPPTVALLRSKWPQRCWLDSFEAIPAFPIDLVIASDVIEHLPNPDDLLHYVEMLHPRYIVLSTPDRNLIRLGTYDGPPANSAHAREWSFAEFDAYVSHYFDVEDHFISFAGQATQCILCKPRTRR